KAMIPTLIAVSSSFAFIIGATEAIAAAPHIPVPTPNKKEIILSAFNKWAIQKVNKIEKIMTPTSLISKSIPSFRTIWIFNFNPYKTIAVRNKYLDEKAIPE